MVLPHTGYGDVLIVELPCVRIEQDTQLKASFAALKQADGVGQCRVALELFFEPADPHIRRAEMAEDVVGNPTRRSDLHLAQRRVDRGQECDQQAAPCRQSAFQVCGCYDGHDNPDGAALVYLEPRRGTVGHRPVGLTNLA